MPRYAASQERKSNFGTVLVFIFCQANRTSFFAFCFLKQASYITKLDLEAEGTFTKLLKNSMAQVSPFEDFTDKVTEQHIKQLAEELNHGADPSECKWKVYKTKDGTVRAGLFKRQDPAKQSAMAVQSFVSPPTDLGFLAIDAAGVHRFNPDIKEANRSLLFLLTILTLNSNFTLLGTKKWTNFSTEIGSRFYLKMVKIFFIKVCIIAQSNS